MQFSLLTLLAATLAATTTTAITVPYNGTTTTAPYPSGAGKPTGTGHLPSKTSGTFNQGTPTPFTGAAVEFKAGSAMAIVIAGGAALMF